MNEQLEGILENFPKHQEHLLERMHGITGHDLKYMKKALQMNFADDPRYQNGMTGAEIIEEFYAAKFEISQLPSQEHYASEHRN